MAGQTATEFDREVGARIRRLRRARGIGLAELAHPIGVSYQQMQKYEQGQNRLSLRHATIIADALGIGLDDLTDRTRPMHAPRAPDVPDALHALRVHRPDLYRSMLVIAEGLLPAESTKQQLETGR